MRRIIVDVETSGQAVGHGGRVIEVAGVVIENGRIVSELATLIDCGAVISPAAFRVHGISADMLRGEPLPHEVWPAFADIAARAEMVAHNAPFDGSFVRHELALLGREFANQWHCTVRLSRRKLPHLPNHRLETVYQYLFGEIPGSMQRHRALDDARMAARIWLELTENV